MDLGGVVHCERLGALWELEDTVGGRAENWDTVESWGETLGGGQEDLQKAERHCRRLGGTV